jgi:hypothetical protein
MADVGRFEGKWNMAKLDEIGQEKQRVSERLTRLDTERARLADQLGELEIAERVLSRFTRAVRTKRHRRGGSATTAPTAGGERSARDPGRVYGGQASVLPDPPDPLDIGDQGQRVFEPSMTAHKEAETGMSFFITKAQKAALRRLGCREEQIREMKPEDAHRALGLGQI